MGDRLVAINARVQNLADYPALIALDSDGRFRKRRRLPPDVVRICRPSRWGNPWRIGQVVDGFVLGRADVLALFRDYALEALRLRPQWLVPLHGHRLACWCAPLPCHGDILVELGA